MTRTKLTRRGRVPMTAEDIAEADANDADWEAKASERTPEAIAQKEAEHEIDTKLLKSLIIALSNQLPINKKQLRTDTITAYKAQQ